MNCDEFQKQLERAVEAKGPTVNEIAAFEHHIQDCGSESCAERWTDCQSLLAATRAWRTATPQVDLTQRVVDELRMSPIQSAWTHSRPLRPEYRMVNDLSEPSVSRKARRINQSARTEPGGGTWVLGTVAASLLLIFSLLTLTHPVPTEVAGGNEHRDAAEAPVVVSSQKDPAQVKSRSRELFGRPYATMPLSATEFVTDAVVLVVPADLSDPEEEPTAADVWADRLGKKLEPIGRELSSAFEALIDAVPKSSSAS